MKRVEGNQSDLVNNAGDLWSQGGLAVINRTFHLCYVCHPGSTLASMSYVG